MGNIELEVIHTPGHTMVSGDTLFINGVGRPDLRDKAPEFAAE